MSTVQTSGAHQRSACVIASVTTTALLLCAACVFASRSLRTVSESLEGVARTEFVQYKLQDIQRLLSDIESAARDFRITHDDAFLTPYEAARPLLGSEIDRLYDLVAAGIARFGVDALAALALEREQSAAQVISVVRSGNDAAARLILDGGELKSNVAAVRAVTTSLQTEARQQLALRHGAVERSREIFVVALCINGAIAVLLLGYVAISAIGGSNFTPGRFEAHKQPDPHEQMPNTVCTP